MESNEKTNLFLFLVHFFFYHLVMFNVHLYQLIHAFIDGFLFFFDSFVHENYFPFLGIFAPALRASDNPIATACLGFETTGPFLEPLCNSPSLNSCMTFLTFILPLLLLLSIVSSKVTFKKDLTHEIIYIQRNVLFFITLRYFDMSAC